MGKTCVYDTSSEFTYEGIIGHCRDGAGLGGQVDREESNMAATSHHAGLFSGCRVLDFTLYIASPMVTRLMAEMGAEIITVASASGLLCDVLRRASHDGLHNPDRDELYPSETPTREDKEGTR